MSEQQATPGSRLSARAIYHSVRREGAQELARPIGSLWWSGVVAGIAIATSIVAKGLLHKHLPDTSWRPLIEDFGYCVGFVIVVLGRMQLFTENTITAVLPLMAEPSRSTLYCTLRLWIVVLLANLVGTFVAAVSTDIIGLATPEQLAAFQAVSQPLLDKNWLEMLLHAIPAGFFIAAMVWMLPNAHGAQIWVIVIPTYIIAIGGFAHVIVGSMEAFLLLLDGQIGLLKTFWGCLLPVFLGNVLGGTVLFSLLSYGQVRQEID